LAAPESRVCPMCRKRFEVRSGTHPTEPFCSKRCQMADLGNWFEGNYRIPGRPAAPEELTDPPDPGDERRH